MTPAPRKSSTIHPVPPTSEGAIGGWSYTCPRCDLVITYSLESLVRLDAIEHKRWHDAQGSR